MKHTVDRDVQLGFVEEVREYLPRIRHGLERLRVEEAPLEAIEEIHRLVHSIKGAASMIGYAGLGHMAYFFEECVEEFAAGQIADRAGALAAFGGAASSIEEYLAGTTDAQFVERPVVAKVIRAFRRLRNLPEAGDEAEIEACAGRDDGGGESAPAPLGTTSEFDNVPADLLETFRQEADEHLSRMGELLRTIDIHTDKRPPLQDVRRIVHTLKGAAGSIGLRELSRLAHRMEDALDSLQEGTIGYSEELGSLLLSTFDALSDLASGQQTAALNLQLEKLFARYDGLMAQATNEAAASPKNTPGQLAEAFRIEAEDRLLSLADQLRSLQKDASKAGLLEDIRKALHALQAAASVVGYRQMSGLVRRMEELTGNLAEGKIHWATKVQDLLFASFDTLIDLVPDDGNRAGMGARLLALENRHYSMSQRPEPVKTAERRAAPSEPREEAIVSAAAPVVEDEPRPAAASAGTQAARTPGQYVRVPIERLDELSRLISELVVGRSTFEQYLGSYNRNVDELGLSMQRLKRVSTRLDTDFEVSALQGGFGQLALRGVVAQPPKPGKREFDDLEFDHYTDFHLMAREISETTSDIGTASGELRHRIGDFDSYLTRLGRLTSEVQDKLMRMRMVPLATLATRLHRTVRVTSDQTGKQVDLVIEGERVELDKTVIEEIAGPLEHLLRNAVDHGTESASLRDALGKPRNGQVRLRAYQAGTHVVIDTSDDGSGMEPALIRDAGVRLGHFSEAQAAVMTDSEILNVVFEPGFTTAREVSEVSGRGVGLDVVKAAVSRLKGEISISTEPGAGTRFRIRLPMSLAVLRVLLVKANTETYAVPASVVTQIVRVEPRQLERVGNKPVVRVDGKVVPAMYLGEMLGLPKPADLNERRTPALILRIGEQYTALLVDDLLEAREVVVKNLGNVIRRVQGITGATLMGDGNVVLIVDPGDLVAMSQGGERVSIQTTARRFPQAQNRALDILVVDDSVSVRRVLSNLLANNGWNAKAAKDGLEALEILQRGGKRPDCILLDIEMPRMDGYELTAALRAQDIFRSVPIIMLTSRSGEKHRRKAFDLGVTDYLVKPYQEETLVTVIRRVVREAREESATQELETK